MNKTSDHTQHEKVLEKKLEKKEKELKEQKKLTHTLESKLKGEAKQFRKEFADRTLKLMTSGFGLVAALAWNEAIKEAVNTYIKPFMGEGSGVISLFIYAVLVTFLAVLVTYQLSKVAGKKPD
jgi:Na+/melibiose symporter-like transporter